MAVIKNIVKPNDKTFNGGAYAPIKCFIDRTVIIGKVIIVNKLITAVYDIESAVSPLASFVIMFDVTPPGQDANIIIPTAISFVIPINIIIRNAVIGNITI